MESICGCHQVRKAMLVMCRCRGRMMMQKVDVETIAKDLVIMIGEQGHTEEGVVKYLNQYLTRQPVQVVG